MGKERIVLKDEGMIDAVGVIKSYGFEDTTPEISTCTKKVFLKDGKKYRFVGWHHKNIDFINYPGRSWRDVELEEIQEGEKNMITVLQIEKTKPYTFLLQIEKNGHYSEDTATVARLIDERNWLNFGDEPMIIKGCKFEDLTEDIAKNCIAVGSVEFVNKALKLGYGAGPMRPINIPLPLFSEDYLGRKCKIVRDKTEVRKLFFKWNTDKLFVKSNSKIKAGYTDFYSVRDDIPDDSEYFVSEKMDIVSEWRCFVYRGKLKGIKNYCGDPWVLPSKGFVEDCMKEIRNSITAYTLDVAVLKSGRTVVLEIHNFISCGLYGFDDASIIPMTINAFKQEIGPNTK